VGEPTSNGYQVHFPFNQHDLAEILEVRRESVSTRTCQLEHANLIERYGRDLRINLRLARIFLEAAGLPDDQVDRAVVLCEPVQARADSWQESQPSTFDHRVFATVST
jgi:DNA-binding Lrp family transcriptional regulator